MGVRKRVGVLMKLPHTLLINEVDFHEAWYRAVRYVVMWGMPLTIGDVSDPKKIRDMCATFAFTGDAIKQIENKELHPQYPFRYVDQYCKEFTREYQEQYQELPDNKKFVYTYFDRLTNYSISNVSGSTLSIDQLDALDTNLAYQIKYGISSNRNQAVTWRVSEDFDSKSPPCAQSVWCRYLGDSKVEVHWHFRSRDLFGAFQANVIALTNMLNREVIHPNDCEIVKIVDHNDSLHIYMSDMDAASKVKRVLTSPHGGH